jgi:phage gpG-like protein
MAVRVRSNGGFDRYRAHVPTEAAKLVRTYAAKIDDEAKAKAPFEWGTLRRSISHRMLTPYRAVIGSRGVPYARIQDVGGQTSNQYGPNSGYIRPKRYLTGAFAKHYPEFCAKMRRLLRG